MSWLDAWRRKPATAGARPNRANKANKPGKLGKAGSVRVALSGASVSGQYAASPLLAAKTPLWRSKLVVFGLGAGFAVLLGRAVYIQAVATDFYQKQGESRYARTFELRASRGRIVDRNGMLLAASVPAPSIWAIPKELQATDAQKRQLAGLLGMSPAELQDRLDSASTFVWLRRQVDESLAEQVRALGIKGVHQEREYRRRYPEGEAAAQLVGFTNIEEHGQEGIELSFQDLLQGKNGSRSVVRDRLGRVVEDIGESVQPADGRDISLSIDSKIQFFAYQRVRDAVNEHKAKSGSVVVLDAQTGEVLALANYPSYVPGDRRSMSWGQLRNRALTDTFEPGSTMKPFIAGLSLQTGRHKATDIIQTAPGRLTITGATITDAHPHGPLTVEEVIQKSSNVGAVKLAMQMEPREMHELFTAIGLGQKPSLPFPGLAAGRLRPYKSWRPIEQATMAYGYGLSASLFQLARAYTVFAHDGELLPVSLVKTDQPAQGVRVFSPEVAREVRKMLNMVTGPGGTAPQAQAIGYSVGGKTGTAHKQEGKGYASNKYRSWFVGLAPIGRPKVIVAVMVDEPSNGVYFGGSVAGPVFAEVVQNTLRMLGVPPDLDVKPQIVARQQAVKPVEESF